MNAAEKLIELFLNSKNISSIEPVHDFDNFFIVYDKCLPVYDVSILVDFNRLTVYRHSSAAILNGDIILTSPLFSREIKRLVLFNLELLNND